MEKATTQPKI